MSSLNNNTTNGKTYWRSLEELEGKPEFQQSVYNEFPEGNFELSDAPTRRGFMKAMAASVALAGGLTSCRRPEEKIMPYVDAPEDTVPGKAVFYATSAPRSRGRGRRAWSALATVSTPASPYYSETVSDSQLIHSTRRLANDTVEYRSRYNCTGQGHDGRWRWFSQPWLRLGPGGEARPSPRARCAWRGQCRSGPDRSRE